MTTRHAVTSSVLALCSLTAVLWAHTTQAGGGHIGGACVPDSATVRAGVYETRGFGVGFSGSSTGKIRLLCQWPGDAPEGEVAAVTFLSVIDKDGMEAGARVRAHFRRAEYGTNAGIAMGTCDSNTSDLTVPHLLQCQLPAYQFRGNEWYWWDVEIERTNPKVNVEFLGVDLWFIVRR